MGRENLGVVRVTYAPDHDSQYPWLVEMRAPQGWMLLDWYPCLEDAASLVLGFVEPATNAE